MIYCRSIYFLLSSVLLASTAHASHLELPLDENSPPQVTRAPAFEDILIQGTSAYPIDLSLDYPQTSSALVTYGAEGDTSVAPLFKKHHTTLLKMNTLSYALIKGMNGMDDLEKTINQSRRDDLMEKLYQDGWTIQILSGKSGLNQAHDDIPGFVAYHENDHVIAVIFHGSSNQNDWQTNLDCGKIRPRKAGLIGRGKLHRGFALKYASLKNNLEQRLKDILDTHSPHDTRKPCIIVSGHSQGGSIASIAASDLAGDFLKKTVPNFDNKQNALLYGYFIAPTRIGDKDYIRWAETMLGKENAIRHTARHDLVSNLVPGKTLSTIAQCIPLMGHKLAERFTGYEFLGTLALEDKKKTRERLRARQRLYKDPDASYMDKLKHKFYATLAPLHFGSNVENAHDYIFDDGMVSTDLEESLAYGRSFTHHQDDVKKSGSVLKYVWFSLSSTLPPRLTS